MATAKQQVQTVLDSLPEETSLEDIQYHLYASNASSGVARTSEPDE